MRPVYPWLPPGLSKDEARKVIAGSVAFAMGQLGEKTAYWVLYPPKYGVDAGPGEGEGKAFTLEKPEGVTIAPNMKSAYLTIQAMGGKVPSEITGQIGFASYAIKGGTSIKFPSPKKSGRTQVKPRLSR